MSDREKDILRAIAAALPEMSEFEKGRFLGRAEGMATRKKEEQRQTAPA